MNPVPSINKTQRDYHFSIELINPNTPVTATIAVIDGQPMVPRVGDHIEHEDFTEPLTVTRVVWDVHRKFEYTARVFVRSYG